MQKTIITYGLLSGGVAGALMLATLPFMDAIGFDYGAVVGYTGMVLAFLLVYFGIRSFRDNVSDGSISFGRAFTVGFGITLISCVCYVATWEVIYHTLMPDFVDKYAAHSLDRLRASGATPEKMEAMRVQMADFKKMYDNPFLNIAMTFIEPLPVGLGMTLISAGLLRRRR